MNKISPNAIISDSLLGIECSVYNSAEIKKSKIGNFVSVGNDSIIDRCLLEGNISINRRNFLIHSDIGKYTYTGIGTSIRKSKIGRFCSISWGVSIGGSEHPSDRVTTHLISRFYNLDKGFWDKTYYKSDLEMKSLSKCEIGNDVLVSSNAIIIRNVKIGNGAIIGAGAVVIKDVEPYTVVAGVPARVIRKRFDDEIIEALEKIKWWDWPINIIRDNLELIYSKSVDISTIKILSDISKKIKNDFDDIS